jgi:uncharacterized protein
MTMQNDYIENEITPEIKLSTFKNDERYSYELSVRNDWIKELIVNLEEEINAETNQESVFDVDLEIERRFDSEMKDILMIRANLSGSYNAPCVRCLEETPQSFDSGFEACFMHSSFEDADEYKETSHIFCQGQEYELYFHVKGKVDLKEIISEHLYLSVDPLPLHDKNCKGLCHTCGHNLNEGSCEHTK